MNTTIIQTALGPARLAFDNGTLVGLWFRGQEHEPQWVAGEATSVSENNPTIRAIADCLSGHFQGCEDMALPALAPRGTPFQRLVWDALMKIPRGQTTSYGALAASIGRPSATRAVAAAVGRNPISVLIPCHRVIGGNGSLTGYAGGLGRKRALLAAEQGQALPWIRTTSAHQANYENPIEVEVGEWVQWIDREDDGEFPGWKWALAADGREGWAPRSYFGPGERTARARRSYCARELSIASGDPFLALDQFSGWTWGMDRDQQIGWLPDEILCEPRLI